MRIPSLVAAGIRHVRVVRTGWTLDCWHWAVEKCKVSSGFKKWIPFSHLSQILYELEKKSSFVTRALSAKSCTRDTDSLHSCTRLRLVQEMACLYHECKILPRKHSYPNLIPIRDKGNSKWTMYVHVERWSLLKRGQKDAERNGMGRNVARTQTRNAFRVLVSSDWRATWPQINFPCFSSRPIYIVYNFSGKIDRMLKRGLELLWRSNFNAKIQFQW